MDHGASSVHDALEAQQVHLVVRLREAVLDEFPDLLPRATAALIEGEQRDLNHLKVSVLLDSALSS